MNYASASPWHERPIFRRWLKIAVILVSLPLGLMWTPVLLYQFRYRLPMNRAQSIARNYTPPSTQHVVYDDDPQTYPQLLAGSGGYVSSCSAIPGNQYAIWPNPDFARFVNLQISGSGLGKRSYTLPAAYLHERVSPGGNRRIVAVQLTAVRGTQPIVFGLYPALLDPPMPTSPTSRPIMSSPLMLYRAPGSVMRVYDGQIDANDSSRFFFLVEYNGKKIAVHGQLLDDDRVRLMPAIGQVADFFLGEVAWVPPGASIPSNYEPSCFVNIELTKPKQYLASPPGLREWIDDKGMLVREEVKSHRVFKTPAPPLPQ